METRYMPTREALLDFAVRMPELIEFLLFTGVIAALIYWRFGHERKMLVDGGEGK